ncbi:unnamed protein product [Didymodactylos carnosus]|uniref:Uncharacterized protein n=1 Tax=Didymodactylos carnosus TaxID=1234261 RepID=A0A815KKP3_9BILA|nr:unnamed protein product [Didymodactylos carnosus]CAF4291658.1 unnamed protein product [Didymodactylos carnosus]
MATVFTSPEPMTNAEFLYYKERVEPNIKSIQYFKNLIQDNERKTVRKVTRAIFSEQQLAQMSPYVDDLTQRLKLVVWVNLENKCK